MKGNLFARFLIGELFHYYSEPDRKLMKSDSNHYIAPGGHRRVISPSVLVFHETERPKASKSIYGAEPKGENDG